MTNKFKLMVLLCLSFTPVMPAGNRLISFSDVSLPGLEMSCQVAYEDFCLIGTRKNGVMRYSIKDNQLKPEIKIDSAGQASKPVTALARAPDGRVFIAGPGYAASYSNQTLDFIPDPDSIITSMPNNAYISCLAAGPDRSIWAGGSHGGVYRFENGRWRDVLKNSPGFPMSFAQDRISGIAITPDGSVWIGAMKDDIQDLFQSFEESRKCRLAMLKDEKWIHYPYFEIGSIGQSNQTRIVFTGTKMMERDSPVSFLVIVDNNVLDEKALPKNAVRLTWIRTSSLCTSNGTIWVGTLGFGLLEFFNDQWLPSGPQTDSFKNSAIISIASNTPGTLSILHDSIADYRNHEKYRIAWGQCLTLASYHETVTMGMARKIDIGNPKPMQLIEYNLNTMIGFTLAETPHCLYTISGKRLHTQVK